MDKEFDMSQEMIEASDLFDMNLDDPREATLEDQGWEYVASKDIYTEDGFRDVYYWYRKDGNNRFFFSSDVDYGDHDYFDWETEGDEAAQEWFDSYGKEDESEFDDEFTYESFNPDLSRAERKYFIHKPTDELQKEPYYYSKEEANDIAIKRADNLGPDWRVRWAGDLDAQIRQEVRSTATKAEWEDSKKESLTEEMMFKPMSLEDAKEFYDQIKNEFPKGNTLAKQSLSDIYFFTNGLTTDYGKKPTVDDEKSEESLKEDLQTDIVSKSEAKKAYDNGETVYISYAGREYYGYSNSMGTSFEDLLDSRYGNSKNLSFMVDHRPLTKDVLLNKIKVRNDINKNESLTEAFSKEEIEVLKKNPGHSIGKGKYKAVYNDRYYTNDNKELEGFFILSVRAGKHEWDTIEFKDSKDMNDFIRRKFKEYDESLKESADDSKIVIYKVGNIYHTTDEDNYNARIQNARKIHAIDGAESAQDIIDYYIRYGWADSKDDFIVIDESIKENKSKKKLTLEEDSDEGTTKFSIGDRVSIKRENGKEPYTGTIKDIDRFGYYIIYLDDGKNYVDVPINTVLLSRVEEV